MRSTTSIPWKWVVGVAASGHCATSRPIAPTQDATPSYARPVRDDARAKVSAMRITHPMAMSSSMGAYAKSCDESKAVFTGRLRPWAPLRPPAWAMRTRSDRHARAPRASGAPPRGGRGPGLVGRERPEEDQELADEAAQPRQADRGEHDHEEAGREDRRLGPQTAEVAQPPRVAAVVEQAHAEEEPARRDAVREHLIERALHAGRRHRHDAEDDEPEVRHGRVGDELLSVAR